jgi:hypothetical protein
MDPAKTATTAGAASTTKLGRCRLAAAVLALMLSTGCVELGRAPGVLVASSPPGARIVVDGKDSGFVTPAHLGLSRDDHRLDIVLPGYQTASVRVDPTRRWGLIYWREAYVNSNTWRFPLWLNARDGFAPVKIDRDFEPGRIHVPLLLAAEP